MEKACFEVREVDAWRDVEGWTYNTTYYIGEMKTGAKNVKRAFVAWLKKYAGVSFKLNRTLIRDEWDMMEIVDRKTDEPLYVAIYREEA